jgi:hypothetical protein
MRSEYVVPPASELDLKLTLKKEAHPKFQVRFYAF